MSCYYHAKPSLPAAFCRGWSRAAVPLAGPRWRREAAITKSLAHLRQAPRSSLHGAYLKCFGPDSDSKVSKSGWERAGRGLLCLREAAPEQRALSIAAGQARRGPGEASLPWGCGSAMPWNRSPLTQCHLKEGLSLQDKGVGGLFSPRRCQRRFWPGAEWMPAVQSPSVLCSQGAWQHKTKENTQHFTAWGEH